MHPPFFHRLRILCIISVYKYNDTINLRIKAFKRLYNILQMKMTGFAITHFFGIFFSQRDSPG